LIRPTAQNLFYAVHTVYGAAIAAARAAAAGSPAVVSAGAAARRAAIETAQSIADDDAACCRAIGEHGAALLGNGSRVSTHCNAGWLAFVDWGSALSPIFVAQEQGKRPFVWVDETRPRLQGANLTAWELEQQGVEHAVIADNAGGYFMRRGEVDLVIVGSDRIAANGDVANKIGTYSSAVVARSLGIPFYVAAPTTTIDPDCPSGDDIPIEERDQDELHCTTGVAVGHPTLAATEVVTVRTFIGHGSSLAQHSSIPWYGTGI
jgi:S-methyl-5-thioribose-1-phosphate isomerase